MSFPKTWEEATEDIAVSLPSFKEGEDWTLDEVLHTAEEQLEGLRDDGGDYGLAAAGFRWLAWLGAVGYVLEKFGPATQGSTQINFVQRCNDVVKSTLVLLPKKQHDYGPDNILWGGVQGVVVRAHDKLARIKNLRARQLDVGRNTLSGQGAALNEPLSDSYFDLIGYGIVGAMLVKGTFQLPLEADLRQQAEDEFYAGAKQEIIHYGSGKKGEEFVVEDRVRAIVRDELAQREQRKMHHG